MQLFIYKNNSGKYRLKKWIIVILSLLFVGTIGALLLMARWKPILSEKLKEGVRNRSFDLYKLDFKDLSINVFTGDISLYEVSLIPDTAIYNQFKALGAAPVNIFEIKLKELQLNRMELFTAYFKRAVKMKSVILNHPSIRMIHHQVRKLPEALTKDHTLYQLMANRIKSIGIEDIKIMDADFDYSNGDTGEKIHALKHLSVYASDFLLDSITQFDAKRYYYAKDIGFELKGYQSLSKDGMYTMKVDTIRGSALSESIHMKGIQLIPMQSDLTSDQKNAYRKDRYDLKFSAVSLEGLSSSLLKAEEKLQAEARAKGQQR